MTQIKKNDKYLKQVAQMQHSVITNYSYFPIKWILTEQQDWYLNYYITVPV